MKRLVKEKYNLLFIAILIQFMVVAIFSCSPQKESNVQSLSQDESSGQVTSQDGYKVVSAGNQNEEVGNLLKKSDGEFAELQGKEVVEESLAPISRYPEEGRAFKGDFILVFPEEIYFPQEIFPDEYVKSIPSLKGRAECAGNMLVFKLIEQLPKNISQIELCINPELRSKSGKRISNDARCYKVSGESFRVVNSWFEEVSDEYIKIGLRFNRYISGKDLSRFIQIVDFDGNKVEWAIDPYDDKEVLAFHLNVKRSTGNILKRYRLYISPGYTESTKTLKGEEFYLEFPLKDSLKIISCAIRKDFVIYLYFSNPVVKEVLLKNLRLELVGTSEKVKFDLTSVDPSKGLSVSEDPVGVSKEWYIKLDKSSLGEVERNFILTLGSNLCSRDMTILGSEFKKELSSRVQGEVAGEKKSPPIFPGFNFTYWQNGGLEGPVLVGHCIALPSIEEINKHIEVVPKVSNLKVTKVGNSLRIYGDWKTGGRYILKLTAGMKFIVKNGEEEDDEEMGELENDYELVLEPVPEFKALEFANEDKFYFIPYGEKNYIRVGGRNISKAYVHLYRVIPENLAYWVGNVSSLNQIHIEVNERTSDYVGAKEIVFNNAGDKTQYLEVNLDELVSKVSKRGLFTIHLSEDPNKSEVKFDRSDDGWEVSTYYGDEGIYWDSEDTETGERGNFVRSSPPVSSSIRYFVWTRIGVVAHWDGKRISGFVHDLLDLNPIVRAEAIGYSVKGREVGRAVTNEDGIFNLGEFKEEAKLIIVRALDDFSILFLSPKPLPSMKDLEKYDKFDGNKIEAFVYTDRNIYRPGEIIHARWIVRRNYGKDIVDAPLELRVINPKNRIILQKLVNLSEFGTGGEDIQTDVNYLTGAYSLGLYIPGGERLCGAGRVHLEDFVPDRIKVETSIDNKNWIIGKTYQIGVKANYYVGPPGANLKCEGKVLVYKSDVLENKIPGYSFTNSEEYLTYLENLSAQFTDERGATTYSYEFRPKNVPTCPVEVVVRTEVLETGGRAVGAVAKTIGYPEDVLCGIGIESEGNKVRANVILVDTELNPAPDDEVEVSLGTLEWTYVSRVLSTSPRRVVPQWQEKFVLGEKKVVKTSGGRAVVEFEIPESFRNYRIRAKRVSGTMFSETSFYRMWNRTVSVKDGPPELVKLIVEDKKWEIGEEVPVVIQAPFDGKAFVAIQGERLWDSTVINIVDGKGEFRFEVKPEYFPNVWVAANAIPARLEEKVEISPCSSFSFKNISIDDKLRKLDVEIVGLPTNVMPRSKLEFDVLAKGENNEQMESEITVAIVDEGIHSILGYVKPEPYEWFRRDRYNPLQRAHYYENVAYEYNPESPAGDIIARQLSAGKPNIGESWIKPFTLWSGVVKTNNEGRAHLEFDLPEFNGKARVVVVGVSSNKLGSAEGYVDIKRPCVIQVQLPRFLRPGDKALVFARGVNTLRNSVIVGGEIFSQGGKISRTYIEWEVPSNGFELSPFIEVESEGYSRCVELAWKYRVRDKSGAGLDEFSDETKIPVYLTSMYKREMKTYVVKPGETLSVENSGFEENSFMSSEVWVGGAIALRVVPIYNWLSSYPYGCAEQKLSKLYAMYMMRKYFLKDLFQDAEWENVHSLFVSLINSIFACQHPNGGVGFWPNSAEPSLKVSLHAGFLLASMRRFSELPIPEKRYIGLMNYIRGVGSGERGSKEGVNDDMRAFAYMILALDGDPVACERLEGYLTGNWNISWEIRTLMRYVHRICYGEANYVSPDENSGSERETDKEYSEEVSVWGFGETNLLRTSLKLLDALYMRKSDSEILDLQVQLLDLVSSTEFLTTYDLPFVLIALEESTKRFGKPEGKVSGEVKINDEVISISSTNLKRDVSGKVKIEVKNTGEAPIYLSTLFAGLSVADEELTTGYKGVVVNRYIYDKNGALVSNGEFSQGELYYFVYTVSPCEDLEGFVLTQLLPAGLELENPRLYDERFISSLEKAGESVKTLIEPEHVEIRDDKLIVACPHLKKNLTVGYVCAVRAVTRGEFEFPGFMAEDLYKPSMRSSSSKMRIYVK